MIPCLTESYDVLYCVVFQLVCQSLEYKVTNMMAHSEEDSCLLQSLLCVHQAYRTLSPRLKYFRAMNAVWPDCSGKIMDLKQEDPENEMFKEEEFVCFFYSY